MQSAGRLEKMIECITEKMLSQTIKVPTVYSEAYLSGRDIGPIIPQQQSYPKNKRENEPSTSSQDQNPPQSSAKKLVVKKKTAECVTIPTATQPLPPANMDWTDCIVKDEKSMSSGVPVQPYSDAYLVNMSPRIFNGLMSQKFVCPAKSTKDSIMNSGIGNMSSIQEEAAKHESLTLAIRNTVGMKIKGKISKMENVPEELKRDIELVFN